MLALDALKNFFRFGGALRHSPMWSLVIGLERRFFMFKFLVCFKDLVVLIHYYVTCDDVVFNEVFAGASVTDSLYDMRRIIKRNV